MLKLLPPDFLRTDATTSICRVRPHLARASPKAIVVAARPRTTSNYNLPVSTTEQANAATEGENGIHRPAYKLSHFPFRELILIVVPPLVRAYFVVLKTTLLSEDPEVIPYGHRNAK